MAERAVEAHHHASFIGILGHENDLSIWQNHIRPAFPEFSGFHPTKFWRHETSGDLWEAEILAADDAGNVAHLHFDQHSIPTITRLSSGTDAPDDQSLLSVFAKHVRAGKLVSERSQIALIVNRPYDAAQRYFQLKLLYDRNPGFSPEIILRPDGNCYWIDELVPSSKIVDRKSLSSLQAMPKDPTVSIIQCIKWMPNSDFEWRGEFRKKVRQWYSDAPARHKKDRSIGILISFELEKRVFVRQLEYFQHVLSTARSNFESIVLFINGMTGGVDGGPINAEINRTEMEITSLLLSDNPHVTDVVYMGGKSMQEKAALCASVDAFFAPLGTASTVPMMLGIPGIAYCSPKFYKSYAWMKEGNSHLVPPDKVWAADAKPIARPKWAEVDSTGESYDIDMEYLQSVTSGLLATIAINEDPMKPL